MEYTTLKFRDVPDFSFQNLTGSIFGQIYMLKFDWSRGPDLVEI